MIQNSPTTISREAAVERLLRGEVGVMPTDTVYGLVARAEDPKAVARLYELKNRDHKPGTIIAASTEQLQNLGVPNSEIEAASQWWPDSLSIVLHVGDRFAYLHQGIGDVAIRVVADSVLIPLLETTGPLLTSSANHPGAPGAVTVRDAWDYFNDRIDFYVDGGDLSGRPPSTLIKLHDDGTIEVIRDGAVKLS